MGTRNISRGNDIRKRKAILFKRILVKVCALRKWERRRQRDGISNCPPVQTNLKVLYIY